MPKSITPHEALIYIMVTMSAADRKISEIELDRIGDTVKQFPVFHDYDTSKLVKTAENCGDLLSEGTALNAVLDLVAEALPLKLRETAYALAVDVAAVDMKVTNEEIRLLELLRDALNLDKLVTAAIERCARARAQTL
ncbi:MAG: tellurite resistance TerB family protein [Hyphomicrobiales bacterium]|nr:tellurite resistance TerB family protein [Hyphomicrobiales bacterium]